jgi:hypothetical protein
MLRGIDAKLRDVSTAGVGVLMNSPLEQNEQIKLQLCNEIQRFEKEIRGTVRHITPWEDGQYLIGIELFTRLTPREVLLLKHGDWGPGNANGPTWI